MQFKTIQKNLRIIRLCEGFLTNSLIALTIISANPCIVFAECGMKGSFMERFPLDKDDHQIEGRPIERPSCCF